MVSLGCCAAVYIKRNAKTLETILDDVVVTVYYILWGDSLFAGTLCNGYTVFVTTTDEEYILAFEESYGYLKGTYARDKDAVSAAMLIAEACAYFKENGKSLYGVLLEIYEKYGYYKEDLYTITLKGVDGSKQIDAIMSKLIANLESKLGAKLR